jgi:excisionase family DNA binding protein
MRDFDPMTVPVNQIHVVLARLAAWQSQLLARLMAAPPAPAAPKQPEPEQLLTAREVAQRYSVPETWVYEQARLGKLPSVQLGRYVRFRLAEVEKTIAGVKEIRD